MVQYYHGSGSNYQHPVPPSPLYLHDGWLLSHPSIRLSSSILPPGSPVSSLPWLRGPVYPDLQLRGKFKQPVHGSHFYRNGRIFFRRSLSFNCLIHCVSLQAAIFKILFKVKKLLGFSSSACRIFHFFQAQFFNFYRPFKPTLFLMSCHTTNLGTLCFHV